MTCEYRGEFKVVTVSWCSKAHTQPLVSETFEGFNRQMAKPSR